MNHRTHTWGEEAARRLLLAHGHWLEHDAFLRHLDVEHDHIDWQALTRTPAGSVEAQAVLRLACHLTGHLPPRPNQAWSIAAIVAPLDTTTGILASRAVAMTALGPDTVGPLT